jgi:uncharacterized membrane protein
MAEGGNRAGVLLGAAASVAFALLAHAAFVTDLSPAVGAALSLVPLAAFAAFVLRPARSPAMALAVAAAAAAALWSGWSTLERHFPDLFFLEHAGVNLLLATIFGRTLVAGREPLCTRFARLLHRHLPPEVERYTRGVTIAWTLFFVAVFTASCILYAGHFLAAWSLLANILSPVLVGAMFAVEYAIRLRALPHWERVGVLGGIRAFSRHFAAQRAQAQRQA